MVKVVRNIPINTTIPVLQVDGGLSPGRYIFRLVVVDNDGNMSAPDDQVVTITTERVISTSVTRDVPILRRISSAVSRTRLPRRG